MSIQERLTRQKLAQNPNLRNELIGPLDPLRKDKNFPNTPHPSTSQEFFPENPFERSSKVIRSPTKTTENQPSLNENEIFDSIKSPNSLLDSSLGQIYTETDDEQSLLVNLDNPIQKSTTNRISWRTSTTLYKRRTTTSRKTPWLHLYCNILSMALNLSQVKII